MIPLKQLTSRFEINILNYRNSPQSAIDFASKNNCAAVVCPPDLVIPVLQYRSVGNYQYKVIVAIDFPDGRNRALDKFKMLSDQSQSILGADGYDVVITEQTDVATRNEMRSLYGYLKGFNRLAEVRWCIQALSRELSGVQIESLAASVTQYPPAFVRMDSTTNMDANKLFEVVDLFRSGSAARIKVGGSYDIIDKYQNDTKVRFDVDIHQAQEIVKEHTKRLNQENVEQTTNVE